MGCISSSRRTIIHGVAVMIYRLTADDIHGYTVMICKGGKPLLMIYQACGLDKKILFAVRTEFFGVPGRIRTAVSRCGSVTLGL